MEFKPADFSNESSVEYIMPPLLRLPQLSALPETPSPEKRTWQFQHPTASSIRDAFRHSMRAGVTHIPPAMKRGSEPTITDALIASAALLLFVLLALLLFYYFTV